MKTESNQSLFSGFDLHLFGQGVHDKIYDLLGAHPRQLEGKTGTNFSVWAPNAQSVSVIGDFNGWNVAKNPLKSLGPSGIWEGFVPDSRQDQLYKFVIVDPLGNELVKADPFGFFAEFPPETASVIKDLNQYDWSDQLWLEKRAASDPLQNPISIYEVHLGSWRKGRDSKNHGWLNYRDLAQKLVKYCREMGFTHIEIMPVSEHPYTGSWGYQTVGYYSVTSRYGNPEDFMYLVDHCHQNGLGVIVDWVPAHFPRDAHGLARFDGTSLFEHADPRQGSHPDWGTLIFNYERNEVRNFLTANALFWFDKYHVDGVRVDAVASMLYLDYSREEGEWIPNRYGGRENLGAIELLKQVNERVHAEFPGVLTIAEESTAWSGVTRPTHKDGLGFSLKWNMGWMNDTLRYMRLDPVHRKFHHDDLTFSLVYAFSENFALPFSHDEVVHGKGSLVDQMPGDQLQQFANLRLLYSYLWTHPGKKLMFMSNEFAQWDEWNCDESIQWGLLEYKSHRGVQQLVRDLNRLHAEQPALHELDCSGDGFEWINCDDAQSSIISFLRKGKQKNEQLITICNFTPVARSTYEIGVESPGEYCEIFNSDSEYYGGQNFGNQGLVKTRPHQLHGRDYSISVALPGLGAVILKKV